MSALNIVTATGSVFITIAVRLGPTMPTATNSPMIATGKEMQTPINPIHPIVVVGAGVLVRYAMATISHTALNLSSIAGLAVKSLPWSFFVGSLGFSVASLTGNANLVSKIYFPREVLPLSVTLAQGFDTQRLGLLLAVLHRHCGFASGDSDVFANIVGGLRVGETAADLAVALAVVSSLTERPVPQDLAVFGEQFGNLIHHAYPGDDFFDLNSGVDAALARTAQRAAAGQTGGDRVRHPRALAHASQRACCQRSVSIASACRRRQ